MRCVALFAFAAGTAGHGTMVLPPVRGTKGKGKPTGYGGGCPNGACLWFSQGCQADCPKCDAHKGMCRGVKHETTIPQSARTYHMKQKKCGVLVEHTPWCHPGTAPVQDPCGVAGGSKDPGATGNGGYTPPGFKRGEPGSALPPLTVERVPGGAPATPVWTAGGTADVAWGITANHGGGYQYRLAPRAKSGEVMTEELFQKTPLKFVGNTGWIRYGENPADPSNQTAYPATYVTTGTIPEGSMWARNPVPACNTVDGESGGAFGLGCRKGRFGPDRDYQFPPLVPGAAGFGGGACLGLPGTCAGKGFEKRAFDFSIVDKVQVPADLEGDYTVSFRWDGEQTPQVWMGCGDVKIVKGDAPVPSAPTELAMCVGGVCTSDPSGVPQRECLAACS